MTNGFTVGALFAGMGGFASGMQQAGYDVLWANEIDRNACKVFGHRLPEVRMLEKCVSRLSPQEDKLEPVDVLVGGFPCQPFSVAGHRKGFDDKRSETFGEMLRVAESLSPKPKVLVMENVVPVKKWKDELWNEFFRVGYHFGDNNFWDVNVKKATGVPQNRTRTFMFAFNMEDFPLNPFTPPPPSTSVESALPLSDFVNKSSKADSRLYLPKSSQYYSLLSKEISDGDSRNLFQLRRVYVREIKNQCAPTLTANMGVGGHNVPFVKDRWGIRKLSPLETAKLQGFDEAHPFPEGTSNAHKYRLVGNAVCPALAHMAGLEAKKYLT